MVEMKNRFALNLGIIFVLAAAVLGGLVVALYSPFLPKSLGNKPGEPQSFSWPVMGTVAEFTMRTDGVTAERAQKLAATAFRLVETNFSVFIADSAVSRLNRGESIRMASDAPFAKVVRFALETAGDSDGAFDPTVNPLMRAWGFRGGTPSVPAGTTLSNALSSVGWGRISISNVYSGEIVVSAGGAELDFGAIAKGYAVDCAYERLVASGYTDFLINLGGNIRVSGSPEPGRSEWNIAVRDPSGRHPPSPLPRPLQSGEAVATSGSYERFVEIDGRRYSHIIDPRTGHPVDNGLGSVSVIAPSAMMADAYSTTLFVLGREAGAAFLSAHPGCTAVFIGH